MPKEEGGSRLRRPQVLKGMRDFPPDLMLVRQHVINAFRTVFERYDFEPIDTPVLEYIETLTGKYGEDEKLIYHFEDHGGRQVGLRYDLTVPLSRFIATHRSELTFPFKRYHIAPVFRADRPQRGRYREFWQCDVDTVGSSSMLADAEVLMVWMDALSAINMPNFVVQINHRKLLQSLAVYAGVPAEQTTSILRAMDKLDKIGRDGVKDEMLRNQISAESAEKVLDLVALAGPAADVLAELRQRLEGINLAQEGIDDLESLFQFLADMSADQRHYTLNLALARGLDYYTGPVFEATVKEPNIGSLGGAGRYDGLIGMFLGEQIPATGASLGLERIVDVIQELGLLQPRGSVSEVMVTVFSEDLLPASLGFVSALRRASVNAEVYLDARRDLRRQIQYADKRGIPIVAFLGPEEVAQGRVNLRWVATGEQTLVDQSDAPAAIARLLGE